MIKIKCKIKVIKKEKVLGSETIKENRPQEFLIAK